jgi:6-pyruvoyltetrahydropterin/6-carboxytetrahydropterin synthase
MIEYGIERIHHFSAGHRIMGHKGKCQHLHGHNYEVRLQVWADKLDELGMVADFGLIKTLLCNWIDDHWDHRFLMFWNDTAATRLAELDPDGVVFVGFNPTAENMAKHLLVVVAPKVLYGTGLTLRACTIQETPSCSATAKLK